MSLLVTGTIGIDTVETPTGRVERVLGGSCAYFAAAASFHADVRVVAAVGGDWPAEHRTVLESFSNVALDGLEVREDSTTFAWGGRYFDNMNERETLFTHLGVLEQDPPDVPAAFADSDIAFLANTHPAEQLKMLDKLTGCSFVVADTMDLWINVANDELHALMKRINGLVLNDAEAELLTGTRNAIAAGRKILDLGPSFVVVKKGEHGCVLVHQDGVAALPAFPAEADKVVDPTGAGDSFAGGMMGFLAAAGKSDLHTIQRSLAWGTVTASFTIESFSLDRLASLTRPEIDARMDQFRAAVRVD
jgi:sugar/nucleoside kinase (ribokinase family)